MSSAEPWEEFADAVLQAEAAVALEWRGEPPRDFAGMYIDDSDLERSVAQLPGLRGPGAVELAEIRSRFGGVIDDARKSLSASLQDPDDRFAIACWNARLTPQEAEVFAVLAATELSAARQKLVAYVQDNVALARLTLGTLRRMFPRPHPGPLAVGVDSRIRRACLVEVGEDGPWASRMLATPASITWLLAGDHSLDNALPPGIAIASAQKPGPSDGQVFVVSGGDRLSRRRLAEVEAGGHGFLVTSLPFETAQWAALIREATMRGLSVLIELLDDQSLGAVERMWVERAEHLGFVLSATEELPLETIPSRPWREVTVPHSPSLAYSGDDLLSAGHRLNAEQLEYVELAAAALDVDRASAVRRLASGKLGRLATRIAPDRQWAELVLPSDQLVGLRELVARYRQRDVVYRTWGFRATPSSGVVALFAGPSGTGKTMTAEIIAGELGLDLYKIDLSSIVSKYIGETEKNLSEIFAAAEAGNAVLFFDEADSLFGKRSEVSDAHDRYANIEVSYLLQRLERHNGLVILATNFQKNIDQAFLRRIHIAVQFTMPEIDERRRIWQSTFPAGAPLADLDYDFLARQFKITGGSIRNAALHSAFLAADTGEPITMPTVMLGLRREFQKLGRLRTESEFDRYYELVREASDAAIA